MSLLYTNGKCEKKGAEMYANAFCFKTDCVVNDMDLLLQVEPNFNWSALSLTRSMPYYPSF